MEHEEQSVAAGSADSSVSTVLLESESKYGLHQEPVELGVI